MFVRRFSLPDVIKIEQSFRVSCWRHKPKSSNPLWGWEAAVPPGTRAGQQREAPRSSQPSL